jgi:hypothetical protein
LIEVTIITCLRNALHRNGARPAPTFASTKQPEHLLQKSPEGEMKITFLLMAAN